jgi:hypothetical protein
MQHAFDNFPEARVCLTREIKFPFQINIHFTSQKSRTVRQILLLTVAFLQDPSLTDFMPANG